MLNAAPAPTASPEGRGHGAPAGVDAAPAPLRVSFADLPDLAAEALGGRALKANDEFFAGKENLLKAARAVFIADKFTSRGKWMDGWESRRKRVPGHDWCVVRLGLPGVIRGIDVDTEHFTGNFPEFCSLDAAGSAAGPWTRVLPKTRLQGGTRNLLPVYDGRRWTHVRLNIHPDGGVARLRVYGEVLPDLAALRRSRTPVDLAALANGGSVVSCNDMFFGPKDNLILPGRAKTMGGGWETRRKRVPGHDWIIVRLAAPAKLASVEVDTHHFKGNFPESCRLEACRAGAGAEADLHKDSSLAWTEVLPRTKLRAHARHLFARRLRARDRVFDHVRLSIFPDGGVSRLRVLGWPA